MLRITAEAFVPPGYMDSGWAPYTVYCVEDEGASLESILRNAIRCTEITKLRDIRYSVVAEPPMGALVVDTKGNYVRTHGWEAA